MLPGVHEACSSSPALPCFVVPGVSFTLWRGLRSWLVGRKVWVVFRRFVVWVTKPKKVVVHSPGTCVFLLELVDEAEHILVGFLLESVERDRSEKEKIGDFRDPAGHDIRGSCLLLFLAPWNRFQIEDNSLTKCLPLAGEVGHPRPWQQWKLFPGEVEALYRACCTNGCKHQARMTLCRGCRLSVGQCMGGSSNIDRDADGEFFEKVRWKPWIGVICGLVWVEFDFDHSPSCWRSKLQRADVVSCHVPRV